MDEEFDPLHSALIVWGYSMSDLSKIVAALVIKLGGEVTISRTEYEAASGLLIEPPQEGEIQLSATTGASLCTILDSNIIE